MSTYVPEFVVVAVAIAAILVGVLFGTVLSDLAPYGKAWQREAILKGHAIWAVDKDGGPVFQWKPIGGER